MLAIARENINHNPSLQNRPADEIAKHYVQGLGNEVGEVENEIRDNNHIHLQDELSDIAWDYACLLMQLESCGYIESAEAVLSHGCAKYTERLPAFMAGDQMLWDNIKAKQKSVLKAAHEKRYGN